MLTFCVRNSNFKESYKETRKTFKTFVFELIIWWKYKTRSRGVLYRKCVVQKTPVVKSMFNKVADP